MQRLVFETVKNGDRLLLSEDQHVELVRLDFAKMRAVNAPLREELLRLFMQSANLKRARDVFELVD